MPRELLSREFMLKEPSFNFVTFKGLNFSLYTAKNLNELLKHCSYKVLVIIYFFILNVLIRNRKHSTNAVLLHQSGITWRHHHIEFINLLNLNFVCYTPIQLYRVIQLSHPSWQLKPFWQFSSDLLYWQGILTHTTGMHRMDICCTI